MACFLRQSTAVDIAIGPFLDETDGKTPETALSITQPDIRLKKNGGAWAQKSAAQTLTHEENGWYEVSLSTTDTNTLGILMAAAHKAGALPCWREFMVIPANIYDSMVDGSDLQQVDVSQFGNAAGTFAAGRPEVNTTHLAGSAVNTSAAQLGVNVVNAGGTAWGSGAITASSIATGAFTAAKFAAGAFDAVWSVATRLLTAGTNIVLGKGTGITGFNDLDAAGVRSAVGLASASLDTQLSTIAGYIDTEVAATLAAVDTEVAAIKSQTDKLTFDGDYHLAGNLKKISDSAAAADNLEAGTLALVRSTCAAGSTTTTLETNLTEATNDHYNGRAITFYSGNLAGQSREILDYNGATKQITVAALTEAPANTDAIVIS